jgi:hypothetical protein
MKTTISKNLTNEQIIIVALWWLRGELEMADIEDVAMAADELAERRFRWRKYPDQINIQTVGKALRDAKKHGYSAGTSARGWMLTEAGIAEARSLAADAPQTPARRALTSQQKAWLQKERTRLLSEDAFKKLERTGIDTVSDREILRFFRLDEYITGETRRARVARITNSFGDDPRLGPATQALAGRVAK